MNIPNILTSLRILLIPILVAVYYLPFSWSYIAAALLFMFAGFTDWLDGYLARKMDQSTPLGAFLDPVADKLIVTTSLVVLTAAFAHPLVTIPAVIIVGREIVISALREWMAELGKRSSVAVSWLGKVKTFFQMGAITLLLAGPPGSLITQLGMLALAFAAVLTIWSMAIYLKAALPDLTPAAKNQ